MELLLMANWLDTNFQGFDFAIQSAMHNLGEATNYNISYFFRFITALAEHGYAMMALAALLIIISVVPAFRKKNPKAADTMLKMGLTAAIGMAFGLLVTNLSIKPLVARIRPYDASDLFYEWWQLARGNIDLEYSFPSGHTTCTMATMTAIFIWGNKKYSWTAFIMVLLMGMSRIYFMMHYPTDVIGGIIIGGVGALIGALVVKLIYGTIDKKKEKAIEV